MPKNIEERVRDLEETVKLLYAVVIEGKPYIPGQAEWDRVIEAVARRDFAPWHELKRRGGIIPKTETLPSGKPPKHEPATRRKKR